MGWAERVLRQSSSVDKNADAQMKLMQLLMVQGMLGAVSSDDFLDSGEVFGITFDSLESSDPVYGDLLGQLVADHHIGKYSFSGCSLHIIKPYSA